MIKLIKRKRFVYEYERISPDYEEYRERLENR